MPILATFVVPHPPLIVPEVGRGGEEAITLTRDSYLQVAKEIASLEPETIIISSPHAPFYSDGFYLSDGEEMEGNLGRFNAREVSFHETIDSTLATEIEVMAANQNFPARRIGDTYLDHGTMIPLYFIRKFYKKGKIVLIGCSQLSLEDHYRLGKMIQDASNLLKRKVVYVASGDLSHKLKEDGPYGFDSDGPIYDQMIMDTLSRAAFGELLTYDEQFLDKVAECGHPSFTMMAGFLDGIDVLPHFFSHEDVTGVGYGICSFYPIGVDENRMFLKEYVKNNNDPYVSLARDTIYHFVREGMRPLIPSHLPSEMTHNEAGVFVSIHKDKALRGCIGTFLPTCESIASEIVQNAISAASQDPRFPPITADELDSLSINVDVLSTPEEIHSLEELDPKKYGVIVVSGAKRGLLLPDLEGVDTIEEQIQIAKNKAGILPEESIQLYRFSVTRHKES